MAQDEKRVLKALRDLSATCHDAEEGFAKAAKGVRNTELSNWLVDLSGKRGEFADEWEALVKELGEQPEADMHVGGILHSGWVDLDTRVRGKDEHEILQECLRGDQGTLKHYDHAAEQPLSAQARAVLDRQRNTIEAELKTLRDRTEYRKAQTI